MYVMKKDDGKTYVYVRNGKTYVNTLPLVDESILTVYMPDGTLLTNASVTVNGTAMQTDGAGKIYLQGTKGKMVHLDVKYNESYMAKASAVYGEDVMVNLEQLYLLTVTATGFTYSDYFTVTTTINGVDYVGSMSVYLKPNTSVTIKNVGYDSFPSDGYYYHSSYVKVDGTNTGKASHTFTMDSDHAITFTNGSRTYQSVGT